MIKDGQVIITVFRPRGNGIARVTASLPAGAYKASHTVRGKGVVVGIQASFMWPSPLELSGFDAANAAKACASLRYRALVEADPAGDATSGTRRIYRKSIGSAALIMNGLDAWPHLIKMGPDAIGTEA